MWPTPLGEAPQRARRAVGTCPCPADPAPASSGTARSHTSLLSPSVPPVSSPPRSPFAGIYAVWQCTCVSSKASVPVWILVIGGVGLVLGLATYGYKVRAGGDEPAEHGVGWRRACAGLGWPACRLLPPRHLMHPSPLPLCLPRPQIMRVLGVKMTKLTNSRG